MIPYKQETKYDCGIRALSFALQRPFEELKKIWGWKDYNNFRDNLKDSPYHHFCLLDNLGVKYKKITLDDILCGKFTIDKTVCLIHFEDDPYLHQHWIVLTNGYGNFICVQYGDGTVRLITKSDFIKLFNSGWPQCAYIVGEGENVTPWYQKLYCKLINIFL